MLTKSMGFSDMIFTSDSTSLHDLLVIGQFLFCYLFDFDDVSEVV